MKPAARAILFLVGLAAAISGIWWLRSDLAQVARPSQGRNIIAFGDSLVAGRGASSGQDFVSVLSKRLGTPVINAGRSGDTSGSALTRLNRDVLSRNPRIVIVLLGGNDVLRRIPTEETFRNLSTIVERIRQQGAAVVLVGVSAGVFTDPYEAEYAALARRTSAALVPDVLDGIIGHADLMADPIHPNDRGYAVLADRLEHVVRDLARPE